MSGLFDKRRRSSREPSLRGAQDDYDPTPMLDDGVTTAPAGGTGGYPASEASYDDDLLPTGGRGARVDIDTGPAFDPYSQPRPDRLDAGRPGPIVLQDSVTGQSLTLVITIMCFLACLTAGTVYMIQQTSDAWLRDIASEVTVQIEAREGVDAQKMVTDVTAFLKRQPGLARVVPMSEAESAKLLEPWLGSLSELGGLPIPRLIAVEVDRAAPASMDALRVELERRFSGASLDDHRQWQKQIQTITRSFALGGLAILCLVAAATMAIIVSATKSSMASNKEIVEVLHFVGATDRFIAREFEKHFLTLGIRAGLVGAACALAVFMSMPVVVWLLGGGSLTAIELQRLVGKGSLDLPGYVLMGIVVVIIAALCMLTSRYGVFRILNSRA